MSIYRRAAKSDTSRATIVKALRAAHVEVFDIRRPVDVLCRYWHPKFSPFIGEKLWKVIELKTAYGKKNPKARVRNDQKEQNEFIERTNTPVATTSAEAFAALGLQPSPSNACGGS